jgi:hypothetical protein
MASRLITTNETADKLCVTVYTVLRWIRNGLLASRKITRKTILVYYPFRSPNGNFFTPPERQREK